MRILFIAALAVFMSGCKLGVIVVEGGEVQSTGNGTCLAGQVCVIESTLPDLAEIFTAVPDRGWQFVRWNSGGNFQCQDSTNPVCVINNTGLAGIAGAEAVIASDAAYYIMPIFEKLPAAPITDIIFAAGNEWANPDLFTNVTWNEVNAVCGSGGCSGELAGFTVDGWIWAPVIDVNALFNSYIGSNALVGPSSFFDTNTTWLSALLADWPLTFEDGDSQLFSGFMRDELDASTGLLAQAGTSGGFDFALTNGQLDKDTASPVIGVFLYRIPPL